MRDMCVHTAVISKNEIVTIKRSIIGTMLISIETDLRRPPPPLATSTPAMMNSSARYDNGAARMFRSALNPQKTS
jgi:hypothetical protein